jgi:hypothetical protein
MSRVHELGARAVKPRTPSPVLQAAQVEGTRELAVPDPDGNLVTRWQEQ